MRVLLVEPPISPYDIPTGIAVLPEPLALETVAAKICEHHEVRLLDMRLEQNLDEILAEFKPHVVGTGSVTANLYLGKQVLQRNCPGIQPGRNTYVFPIGESDIA